jgi:hypothetical protein
MKLESVQFVHVVNHYGQQLQGAAREGMATRPGQPPYELDLLTEDGMGMPCVRVRQSDGRTPTLVPMTNVASFRSLPAPAVTPAKK